MKRTDQIVKVKNDHDRKFFFFALMLQLIAVKNGASNSDINLHRCRIVSGVHVQK